MRMDVRKKLFKRQDGCGGRRSIQVTLLDASLSSANVQMIVE